MRATKKKVFLGGTCHESTRRDHLIPLLSIDYFNPVVEDWTPECMEEERKQREECDYCLYAITPKMTGVFSIAEAVDDSNKRPEKTVFAVFVYENNKGQFTVGQRKSLEQVARMVDENGGRVFTIYGYDDIKDLAEYLNNDNNNL